MLASCLCAFYGSVEAATLTITTDGTVSGAVSAIGPNGGPVCNPNPGGGGGGTCTFTYAAGTPLRLSANSPNTPGIFHDGTGDAASCATSTCTFVINGDSSIIATFAAGDFRSIQIDLLGDGKGNVGTNNSQCQNFELDSNVCTSYYGVGSVVTLEGRSVPGNIFEGFSGGTADAVGCGSTPCVFTLNVNSSIDASFAALTSVAVTPSSASANVGGLSPNFTAVGTFTNSATRSVSGLNESWRTKRPMSAPRFSLAAGVVNNRLYAVGGVPDVCLSEPCDFGPLATVEMYDPVASGFGGIDAWTTKTSMLTPREGVAAAVVNGRIYALGGHTTGGGPVETIEAYDPAANSWALKASMSGARSGLAAAVIDNIIYAVGGDAAVGGDPSMPLNTLEAYDSVSNAWTTKTPMLTARSGLAAAAVNGKLYAIGGDSAGTVEEYDPIADMWITKAPMPNPGGAVAGGAIDGLIYVVAASNGAVKVYNPATNAWATLGSMPSARRQFALGVLDGRLWAAGGLTGDAPATPVATHEAFRPPEATWWSSNTAVATINQFSRTATGLSVGTSTISARTVGIDSAGQSATLTVNTSGGGGGGGGGSQIFLNGPDSAITQVGNPNWGCGSFFDQNASGGPWTVSVNYGDGSATEVLPLIIPMPSVNGCGTGTGMFLFNHAYTAAGFFHVVVTVTNNALKSATDDFTIEAKQDDDDGDHGCAVVSTNLVAGSVPFSTVQMSLFDRTTGELLFTTDVPLGMTELGSAPAGLYRVEFSIPAGYIITPAHIDFDAICGEDVHLNAQITLADVTPPTLSLNGANPMTVEGSSSFVDPGATATDAVDGDLTSAISVTGTVNTNVLGSYTLTYAVSDQAGHTTSINRTVNVVDTTRPTIASVAPSSDSLGPPNHQMVPISVAVIATDAMDAAPACSITGVTSNEAVGATTPDWQFSPNSLLVNLRAERDSTRIYTIQVTCTDDSGNSSTGTTTVTVRHDNGK
jgi:hypothetical protein